jgi:hypothetical protein
MPTAFETAFAQAGLPTASIAFASACRDLAVAVGISIPKVTYEQSEEHASRVEPEANASII